VSGATPCRCIASANAAEEMPSLSCRTWTYPRRNTVTSGGRPAAAGVTSLRNRPLDHMFGKMSVISVLP